MSNLKHVSMGVELSQVEFEGENLHYVAGGTPGNMLILTTGGFLVEAVGNIAAWNDHIIADGKQHADVVTNTTHRGSDGKTHGDVVSNNSHRTDITTNPHAVTKTLVSLGNVPNIDCTNASNISSGTLPSSVLPAIALTETFVSASEVAQLALTVQEGDVCVRTDENKSYIALNADNVNMGDWQVLLTPTDTILSVNTQTGVVVLNTSHITENTNLYYTEARVTGNTNVSSNTTHRGLSNNPHSTDVENLGAGTIAELNSCLSDGSLAEATDITEIRKLTQSTYNGLTPNASTLYFIVG